MGIKRHLRIKIFSFFFILLTVGILTFLTITSDDKLTFYEKLNEVPNHFVANRKKRKYHDLYESNYNISNLNNNNDDKNELKSIYFLHLHKCGGTTLCEFARRNGMQFISQQWVRNCNLRYDGLDIGRRFDYTNVEEFFEKLPENGIFETCNERSNWMQKQNIQFIAVERYFDTDLCFDEFFYMITLRSPVKRIISNIYWEEWDRKSFLDWTEGNVLYRNRLIEGGHPTIDNFFIRSILGKDVYLSPLGSITRSHLDQAKRILEKFKLILILEEWDASKKLLNHLLNWELSEIRRNDYNYPSHFILSHEEIELLTEMNALDIELYEWAKEMTLNRVKTLNL